MDSIKKLIDECINEEKYIYSLEQLYALLEKNNVSIENRRNLLIQVYEYNKKLYEKEKNKSKQLSFMSNVVETKKEIAKQTENLSSNKKVSSLDCDCSLYLEKLKGLKTAEQIISILPNKSDEDFDNIIDMLLVNLYSKKIEIDNYIRQNQYEDDIEEIFAEDLELLDFQMETILDYKDDVEEVTIGTTNSQNEIIFLKNSSLEPVIFQDMKGKEEYYDSFLELLKSIQNGNLKNAQEINSDKKNKIVAIAMNYKETALEIFKDETFIFDFINLIIDCNDEIVNDYIRINNFKINYDSICFSKTKQYKRMSRFSNMLGIKVKFETFDGESREVEDFLKVSDITSILSIISDRYLMLRKNKQEFQKSINKKISLYQSVIELIKKINPNEMINIPENILSKLDYDLFEVFIKYILEHNRNVFSTLEVENIRRDNYDKLEKVFLQNNISIQQLSLDEKNKLLLNGNLDKIDNILKALSTDLWSWINVSNPNFTNVILYSNTEILNYLAKCIRNGIITKENVQTHIGILFDNSFKDDEIKPLFETFKNNIEILNRVLPNLDKRFKNNVEVLFVETSYLENILKLIKKYNLNLKSENAKMYPLEIINHLYNFDDLDSFIELGFKDYIIENPQFLRHDSKNILTRLSIIINIGLDPMSKENRLKPSITNGKNFYVENNELEKYRELKVEEYIENEYFDILRNNERIKIEFVEQEDIVTYLDKIFLKNELEYEINGSIISKIKFLRNLECLMNKTDSYDTNAIFASLVYNSVLANETIEYINQILKDFEKEYKGMSKSFTNN